MSMGKFDMMKYGTVGMQNSEEASIRMRNK